MGQTKKELFIWEYKVGNNANIVNFVRLLKPRMGKARVQFTLWLSHSCSMQINQFYLLKHYLFSWLLQELKQCVWMLFQACIASCAHEIISLLCNCFLAPYEYYYPNNVINTSASCETEKGKNSILQKKSCENTLTRINRYLFQWKCLSADNTSFLLFSELTCVNKVHYDVTNGIKDCSCLPACL